jgi:protein phosphatase
VRIEIPEPCLVVLVGAAGAGKSTFAAARFRPTEVVSSDACRAMVADREDDQTATAAAFELLHLVATLRLRRRRLTVVDAVCARAQDRRPLLRLAEAADCAAVALVLDLPLEACQRHDRERAGRTVGERAIAAQWQAIRRSLPGLHGEGFAAVHRLGSEAEVAEAAVRRVPLPVDRRRVRGPFDVIGDVHGRLGPLIGLLRRLGYPEAGPHPDRRKAVFTGDLTGGGPDDAGVVRLVREMAAAGAALAVRGDRDEELAGTLPGEEAAFLRGLPSHLVLSGGALVVAHAGIRTDLQGRDSARVTDFCLHGEPGWATAYRGRALVVHGHEPVACPRWLGKTLDIHVEGALTALRHPELKLVSTSA